MNDWQLLLSVKRIAVHNVHKSIERSSSRLNLKHIKQEKKRVTWYDLYHDFITVLRQTFELLNRTSRRIRFSMKTLSLTVITR